MLVSEISAAAFPFSRFRGRAGMPSSACVASEIMELIGLSFRELNARMDSILCKLYFSYNLDLSRAFFQFENPVVANALSLIARFVIPVLRSTFKVLASLQIEQ